MLVEQLAARRSEIGPIQDIEELRPKLHVETLRDPLDVVVLEQRKIEVDESWPDHRVAAGIAKKVRAGARYPREWRAQRGDSGSGHRKTEAVELNVVVGVPGIDI